MCEWLIQVFDFKAHRGTSGGWDGGKKFCPSWVFARFYSLHSFSGFRLSSEILIKTLLPFILTHPDFNLLSFGFLFVFDFSSFALFVKILLWFLHPLTILSIRGVSPKRDEPCECVRVCVGSSAPHVCSADTAAWLRGPWSQVRLGRIGSGKVVTLNWPFTREVWGPTVSWHDVILGQECHACADACSQVWQVFFGLVLFTQHAPLYPFPYLFRISVNTGSLVVFLDQSNQPVYYKYWCSSFKI